MPRTISADGRTITVPDDATPEEINQIVGKAPGAKPAMPQMSANPPSQHPIQDWLKDAGTDLREGGDRTGVGRVLGKMQGNEGKYTGLNDGVSKGAADFMGSIPLGAVETAQGVASMKEHPVRGTVDALKGVAHMAEMPSMVMGGPAMEGAPAAITKVLEKLPTATRGAMRLNDVEKAAGELPVVLKRTHDELMRAGNLSDTGATLPTPVKKLLKRYTSGSGQHINYSEARDFYSNLSHLSAKDNMALTPPMRRQIALIVKALKDDIGDTAAQVDKASTYYGGMKDYARAKKAARIGGILKDALTSKAVKTAGAAGAGYAVARAIGKEF
jgi:hypothetical protein